MTTTAAPATATSCAILASDFSQRTTDTNRESWTAGKMRTLLKRLGDTPVAIVVDKQTGHAQIGVTLVRVAARMSGGDGVVVRDQLGHETNFRLSSIGTTIIPLAETRAKWEALRDQMELRSALIGAGMALAKAEGFEPEGRGGRWELNADTVEPGADRGQGRGQVSYRPASFSQKGWYSWVTV